LFVTTAMQALDIDGASCTFDNPAPTDGADITLPVEGTGGGGAGGAGGGGQ
jgi:hypothetical protein